LAGSGDGAAAEDCALAQLPPGSIELTNASVAASAGPPFRTPFCAREKGESALDDFRAFRVFFDFMKPF
jgi:hypothetical protein